jgi:glycosyltransferase involved in cell wall biosynthesis
MIGPTLSICVPSRNRQRYFKETVRFLLDNPRMDVEFVLADNSDDPDIMNGFVAGISDVRVKYLPAGTRVYSMQENWERTIAASTGAWVSVIGDDDLIDPDLVDALHIAMVLKPGLEAFAWSNLKYDWATAGKRPSNVQVPLEATFHDMPQELIFRRAYRWDDAGATLTSGFSVYHSAISRDLLERTKARFGGRYFEHPTIDYDNALKNAALGKSFVYCRRPFSIFGTCPESNTAAAWNPKLFSEAIARFKAETGRDYDRDPWMEDFPFHNMLGMPASVAQVQQFMRVVHGIGLPGWEPNFARACAAYCGKFSDRGDFDLIAGGFHDAFSGWQGARFLKNFEPVFAPRREGKVYTGLVGNDLYVNDDIGGAYSPTGFYRAINGLLERPANLVPELRTASKDSTVISRLAA